MQQHVDNMEFSLKGKPWTPGEEGRHDGIHARSMLCHLISALASRGWQAVVAADVSARHADDDDSRYDPVDIDSIYFLYEKIARTSMLIKINNIKSLDVVAVTHPGR